LRCAESGGRSGSVGGHRAAIRVAHRFDAPPERVFDAWLDPAVARRWLFATATRPMAQVEIDARVAGSFRFADRHGRRSVEHTGEYVAIVPPLLLVFTLALDGHPNVVTRIVVTIARLKAGCELTLTHENVPPARVEDTEGRWMGVLYGLDLIL